MGPSVLSRTPEHSISYNLHVHPPNLTVFAARSKDPKLYHATSEGSDQTAQMRRLIRAFAESTYKIVGITVPQFICLQEMLA